MWVRVEGSNDEELIGCENEQAKVICLADTGIDDNVDTMACFGEYEEALWCAGIL